MQGRVLKVIYLWLIGSFTSLQIAQKVGRTPLGLGLLGPMIAPLSLD